MGDVIHAAFFGFGQGRALSGDVPQIECNWRAGTDWVAVAGWQQFWRHSVGLEWVWWSIRVRTGGFWHRFRTRWRTAVPFGHEVCSRAGRRRDGGRRSWTHPTMCLFVFVAFGGCRAAVFQTACIRRVGRGQRTFGAVWWGKDALYLGGGEDFGEAVWGFASGGLSERAGGARAESWRSGVWYNACCWTIIDGALNGFEKRGSIYGQTANPSPGCIGFWRFGRFGGDSHMTSNT